MLWNAALVSVTRGQNDAWIEEGNGLLSAALLIATALCLVKLAYPDFTWAFEFNSWRHCARVEVLSETTGMP